MRPTLAAEQWGRTDPSRYQAQFKRARSLPFVAATRARDALTIIWQGEPSPLLGGLVAPVTTRREDADPALPRTGGVRR